MILYDSIQKAMDVEIPVSQEMSELILLTRRMYRNKAPWISADVHGLNLPASICTEMSRLVTMESKIEITGSPRADYISEFIKPFWNKLPGYVEAACNNGGCVFKPYTDNGKIAIDVVRQGDFFPVAFDSSGNITACIFPEYKQSGKKLYTRLEYHRLDGDIYSITNKAFMSRKATVKIGEIVNLGQEIKLSDVTAWQDVEPYVEFKNASTALFSYLKIPIANNVDPDSPLGVPVYARAIPMIRDADEQYGATLWEYRSKETAIQAADEFFQKGRDGKIILPRGKERLYHAMGSIQDNKDNPFFNAYSPEIRDQSFFNGYNKIIQKVEFSSGLAYGTLSDPQTVDKTAEEIKTSKQRSYATVKAIQNSTEEAIKGLIAAADAWATIENIAPPGNIEASCDWDDSLVVDKKYEIEQLRADLATGVISPVEYRMYRFKETKEQAIQKLKEAAEYTSDNTQD